MGKCRGSSMLRLRGSMHFHHRFCEDNFCGCWWEKPSSTLVYARKKDLTILFPLFPPLFPLILTWKTFSSFAGAWNCRKRGASQGGTKGRGPTWMRTWERDHALEIELWMNWRTLAEFASPGFFREPVDLLLNFEVSCGRSNFDL